jgi:hypothetical protein
VVTKLQAPACCLPLRCPAPSSPTGSCGGRQEQVESMCEGGGGGAHHVEITRLRHRGHLQACSEALARCALFGVPSKPGLARSSCAQSIRWCCLSAEVNITGRAQ